MSQYLYLLLDIAVLLMIIPLSFDRIVAYVKSWKSVFSAIVVIGIPFLIWDVFFTKWEVWGFNDDYLSGVYSRTCLYGQRRWW